MSLQPPSFLFGLAGGVVAGVIGAVLSTGGVRAEALDPSAGSEGEVARALEPLVVELRELVAALREEESSPLVRPVVRETVRVPVEGSASNDIGSDELVSALRELTVALKRAGSGPGGGGGGSGAGLVLPERERTTWSELPICRTDEERLRFQREHLLWGYQSVLDEYGYPDSVQRNGDSGIRWTYTRGQTGERTYTFYFERGMIARVYIRGN